MSAPGRLVAIIWTMRQGSIGQRRHQDGRRAAKGQARGLRPPAPCTISISPRSAGTMPPAARIAPRVSISHFHAASRAASGRAL